MKFVALHDLPAGEEITQSYFPLDWEVGDRLERCQSVYGFRCTCPRCALETGNPTEEGMDDGYVAVFVLKYLCADETCEGTMVPLLGDAHKTQACNVCGRTRTEAQFLEELQQ